MSEVRDLKIQLLEIFRDVESAKCAFNWLSVVHVAPEATTDQDKPAELSDAAISSFRGLYQDGPGVPGPEVLQLLDHGLAQNVWLITPKGIDIAETWFTGVALHPINSHLRQPPGPPQSEGEEIPDGFTKWEGGECPVDPEAHVRIVLRNGYVSDHDDAVAGHLYWGRDVDSHDPEANIIAYRVIESKTDQDAFSFQGAAQTLAQLASLAEAASQAATLQDSSLSETETGGVFREQTEAALKQTREDVDA